MHVSTLAVVALMLFPVAAAAQNAAGVAVRSPRAFSPFIMEAPPAPDSAAKLLRLTATQKSRYAALRIDYLKKTGAVRDSLRAERQKMQADRGQRRGAAGRVGMRDRMHGLQQSAMAFEKDVVALLTPEQSQAFDQWKQNEATRRRSGRPGRNGPPPVRS